MQAIEFPGCNVVYGKGQPEYNELPARVVPLADEHPDWVVSTVCFQLDKAELQKVKETGQIWFSTIKPKDAGFMPILLNTEKPYILLKLDGSELSIKEQIEILQRGTQKRYNDFTEEEQAVIRKNTCETMSRGLKYDTDCEDTKRAFSSKNNNPIISLKSMRAHRKLERKFYSFWRTHLTVL